MKATGKRKNEHLALESNSSKAIAPNKKDTKSSKNKNSTNPSDYFTDLKERLDKAPNKAEKMKIYNTISSKDRVRLAEYEFIKAGAIKLKHFAPPEMFPSTVAGFEARSEYEEQLNKKDQK